MSRMQDETAGEVPVAFVVRSNGSQINEDDVKQFISKQVNLDFNSSFIQLTLTYLNLF